MRKIHRQKPKYVEISMLNLIDVIFILLVFFMLTTTFKKYWHFDVQLPKHAATSVQEDDKSIQILLDASATLYVGHGKDMQAISIDTLADKVAGHKTATLNADKSLSYDQIINIIALLKSTNIDTIKLNIEK